ANVLFALPRVEPGESHRHQVKQKSSRLTSLSNSKVPALARLSRRQVLATTWHRAASTCPRSDRRSSAANSRPTTGRIASQTLLRLRRGTPQALATSKQGCPSA